MQHVTNNPNPDMSGPVQTCPGRHIHRGKILFRFSTCFPNPSVPHIIFDSTADLYTRRAPHTGTPGICVYALDVAKQKTLCMRRCWNSIVLCACWFDLCQMMQNLIVISSSEATIWTLQLQNESNKNEYEQHTCPRRQNLNAYCPMPLVPI